MNISPCSVRWIGCWRPSLLSCCYFCVLLLMLPRPARRQRVLPYCVVRHRGADSQA